MATNNDATRLLSRTDLSVSLDTFLEEVCKIYGFQKIDSFSPISEGYEDANFHIFTKSGEFVLKIFAKDKTLDEIKSYVTVLLEAKKENLPFIQLLQGNQGYLSSFKENNTTVYYFLSHFFHGNNFESITPTIEDMRVVTNILAKLNSIDIPVSETYDSWGSRNLVKEYLKNEEQIDEHVKNIVLPIVRGMKELDMSNFSRSVIHGDLQRKHVLKNADGKYCILDLGCLGRDARVFDLSIFLAWFCLAEDTWEERSEILKTVIQDYSAIHALTKAELASIPLLTEAAYTAYFLKTSLLIQDGDTSDETRLWHQQSETMLRLCSSWDWNF